jgi:hypothetical protein
VISPPKPEPEVEEEPEPEVDEFGLPIGDDDEFNYDGPNEDMEQEASE